MCVCVFVCWVFGRLVDLSFLLHVTCKGSTQLFAGSCACHSLLLGQDAVTGKVSERSQRDGCTSRWL